MSTAKIDSPARPDASPATVPQDEEAAELTAADFADILTSTLSLATEAGLTVGVRAAQATPTRPAGLLLFVSGLTVGEDGRIAPA